MKSLALFITLLALTFIACNQARQSGEPAPPQVVPAETAARKNPAPGCVNLNKANAEELKTLQGVGEAMAEKIIAYRARHGGFRRPQELIIIEGFSEKKYRAIAEQICVD